MFRFLRENVEQHILHLSAYVLYDKTNIFKMQINVNIREFLNKGRISNDTVAFIMVIPELYMHSSNLSC